MITFNPLDSRWERIVIESSGHRLRRLPTDAHPESPEWWVSPGFLDIQVNGVGSVDFNDPALTPDAVRFAVDRLLAAGVTRFCPTVITGSPTRTETVLRVFAAVCDEDPRVGEAVLGLHLEGPYLSGEDGPRGAHAREWIRDPDWEEFSRWQAASGGRIRMVTVAPERVGMVDFIRRATATGVIVALGHHAAATDQIAAAVDAGARLTTHFGNGAHAVLPRHPNYLWDQLAHPDLWLSVIGDGVHLPPSVLRVVFGLKPGRVILVSDLVADPVMDDGETRAIGQPVTVGEGKVELSAQPGLLAGAITPLNRAIEHTMRVVGDPGMVLAAATRTPAALFGLPIRQLERDWLVFRRQHDRVEVAWAVRDGEAVYRG